jgi:hypothetical protein
VGFDVWADEVVTMSGRAGAPEAEPTVESGADDLPVSEAAGADVQAERPPATNGAQASTKRPAPAVEELDALPF